MRPIFITRPLFSHVLCGALLFASAAAIVSCKTDEPGVRSSYHSQWTTVSGNTVKATEAAKDVLQDMKLKNIDARSTSVDGYALGYTADNTKVNVEIKRVTDNTSEVSVNVGAMGDPELGKDIVRRIQKELGG